jgi:hypothetical protein
MGGWALWGEAAAGGLSKSSPGPACCLFNGLTSRLPPSPPGHATPRPRQQALLWFATPPGYYANTTRSEAQEQLASLQAFASALGSFTPEGWPTFAAPPPPGGGRGAALEHPVWRVVGARVPGYVRLLQLLVADEVKRVRVWNAPLGEAASSSDKPPAGVSRFGGQGGGRGFAAAARGIGIGSLC